MYVQISVRGFLGRRNSLRKGIVACKCGLVSRNQLFCWAAIWLIKEFWEKSRFILV